MEDSTWKQVEAGCQTQPS